MASVSDSAEVSGKSLGSKLVDLPSFKAMRAQSPPKSLKVGSNVSSEDGVAHASYLAWKSTHPSAIEHFDELISKAKGKKVAVFLDYDGTLSPIVEDPDRAFLSEEMREAVRDVSSNFPTAIISGRGREKVFNFVQLKDIVYCGSHGMDIMCPKMKFSGENFSNNYDTPGTNDDHNSNGYHGDANENVEKNRDVSDSDGFTSFQPAMEFAPMLSAVFQKLKEKSESISGALIENNKFSISVHFRRVDEKDWDTLANIVSNVLQEYPKLHTTHGRKVLEVRPVLNWHKGKALIYLLNTLGLNDPEKVLPMYIGDDRTDEDAFNALVESNIGFGVLVSSVAKNTLASYSLKDTNEVKEFLQLLVKWKHAS